MAQDDVHSRYFENAREELFKRGQIEEGDRTVELDEDIDVARLVGFTSTHGTEQGDRRDAEPLAEFDPVRGEGIQYLLVGVSESGWLTPEIATRAGGVAFIINRVGPPVSWQTGVLFEIARELDSNGVARPDIEAVLAFTARRWQHEVDVAAGRTQAGGPERDALTGLLEDLRSRPGLAEVLPVVLPDYSPEERAVLASKVAYDPYPFLVALDVPMLYILAGKDVNVPLEASEAAIDRLRNESGKQIDTHVYANAGHALLRWRALPIEGIYVRGYFELMTTWARERLEPSTP